jgi:hypothetical protein
MVIFAAFVKHGANLICSHFDIYSLKTSFCHTMA